ncbi:mannose-1-phosphate guanylyltransferase, partial [Salipiger sp. IMCC34102]|uniref:mannose-1-phosphate guanylyltransferase n=1 Tax=Salipiger sp. IMCC34102 TaxID=2510647 RepID=UPI00101D5141
MTAPITPVILSGGSGTRLWPLSRASYPKQFAPLIGEDSLFQASVMRLAEPEFAAPLVVTTDEFRFIVTEQMAARRIDPGAVLIESEGRDTAAAVLAATLQAAKGDPAALVLVAPSDHLIPDAGSFAACVAAARPAAEAGRIVTFGIRPTRAETGYGYLDPEGAGEGPQPLKRFVEKPDAATAQAMLDDGHHLWNAGLFLFRADVMRAAFEAHAPETLTHVAAAMQQARCDLGFTRLAPEPWARIDPISIDYAVMEKADNLSVMPYDGAWSDLGDWTAVWRETEDAGLATKGPAL